MQIVLNDVAFLSNNGFAQMLTVSLDERYCATGRNRFFLRLCVLNYIFEIINVAAVVHITK